MSAVITPPVAVDARAHRCSHRGAGARAADARASQVRCRSRLAPTPRDSDRARSCVRCEPCCQIPCPSPNPRPAPFAGPRPGPADRVGHACGLRLWPSSRPRSRPDRRSRRVAARSWRPSTWHVTGAVAATVTRGSDRRRRLARVAVRAVATGRPPATAGTTTVATPEPKQDDCRRHDRDGDRPRVPTAGRDRAPARPRLAAAGTAGRLATRCEADAVFSPSFSPDGESVYFHSGGSRTAAG